MNENKLTCPSLTSSFFFSSTISTRRRGLQLSAAQLARRAALPVSVIHRLEQGQFIPSPSQAYRLGFALQLDNPAAFAEQTIGLLLRHPHYLLEHMAAA